MYEMTVYQLLTRYSITRYEFNIHFDFDAMPNANEELWIVNIRCTCRINIFIIWSNGQRHLDPFHFVLMTIYFRFDREIAHICFLSLSLFLSINLSVYIWPMCSCILNPIITLLSCCYRLLLFALIGKTNAGYHFQHFSFCNVFDSKSKAIALALKLYKQFDCTTHAACVSNKLITIRSCLNFFPRYFSFPSCQLLRLYFDIVGHRTLDNVRRGIFFRFLHEMHRYGKRITFKEKKWNTCCIIFTLWIFNIFSALLVCCSCSAEPLTLWWSDALLITYFLMDWKNFLHFLFRFCFSTTFAAGFDGT